MGFGSVANLSPSPLSSPQYAPASPQYSSIMSPTGSPIVLTGAPTNVVLSANPLQPVMPMGMPLQQGQMAQGQMAQGQMAQGVLSVGAENTNEGAKTEGQGKKTVIVNLGNQGQ
jgi:hypothetical protein